ncbi:MAG: L-lactate permease [Bacillota bacterium]|jgi:lactate permease|nr:L-lactate permease [Bacillota bacterium]
MVSLFISVLPILVILAMLLIWKKPADITGVAGWIAVSILAFLFFDTSLEVIARSSVAGLIKSFAVSLIVAASLLQMALMQTSGALRRVIVFIKTIALDNRAIQIIMINVGFGTLMVSVGATPVSLLPPILLALGYTTYSAIALPAIGYDSLCTYALLGAPIVVLVDVVNGFLLAGDPAATPITLGMAAEIFCLFVPVTAVMIGFCMLWIADRWNGVKKGFLPCITAGIIIAIVAYLTSRMDNLVPLTGVFCGAAVILAMVAYLKLTGKKIIDRSRLTNEELELEASMPLWKAVSPWAILIVLILALNLPKDLFEFFYYDFTMPINGLTANGTPIATRFLWNAYTWIFVSVFLSIPILKPSTEQLGSTFKLWAKRAPRPAFAAAIFFSIGEVMNMSGFNMTTQAFDHPSMIQILADASAKAFNQLYVVVVPYIGLLGGFITGSEASTIGMFGKYALATSKNLGLSTPAMILIIGGLAFGGGLASVISPAKLQNAAASIDKFGEETKVIPMAFVFSIILVTVTALLAALYLFTGIVS